MYLNQLHSRLEIQVADNPYESPKEIIDRPVQPSKGAARVFGVYRVIVLSIFGMAIVLSICCRTLYSLNPDDQIRRIGIPFVFVSALYIYPWALLGTLLSMPLSALRCFYMLCCQRFLDSGIEAVLAATAFGVACVSLHIFPIAV